MSVSPVNLKKRVLDHIAAEIAHAAAGRPAGIWMKMTRCRSGLIDALLSGVRGGRSGDLIVRHLVPAAGVAGLSENIRVKVDRRAFSSKHGRIYCFGGGHGLPQPRRAIYISPPT